MKSNQETGIAIVLAWPQTYCKQPGAWYDRIMLTAGINNNNYYRVGHAAIVLISKEEKECRYFDFGRYHAPFQHGRVRSASTDFDLQLKTRAEFSNELNELKNYPAILNELQSHSAFHGDGILEASYTSINYKKAYQKATSLQNRRFIPYGPFIWGGSNCSRFVQTVLNAGIISWIEKIRLNMFVPLTPTPMSNVNAFANRKRQNKIYPSQLFHPEKKLSQQQIKTTIQAPQKPTFLKNGFWLSGEGCGSWFELNHAGDKIKLKRYSPEGELECQSFFPNQLPFDINKTVIELTYPSNCKELTFYYDNQTIQLQNLPS